MKNTIRVIIFIGVLLFSYYFFIDPYIDRGLLKYISILLSFSVLFIGLLIFLENRNPTQTITWLIVLGSFPFLGFIFYLLFGRNYRKERMFKKKFILDQQVYQRYETGGNINQDHITTKLYHKHFNLADRITTSSLTYGTETKVLTNGDETFKEILYYLEQAEHHIHLEYYIVRHDTIGNDIKKVLIDKANKGVKVRFLYDAVGSWQLNKSYIIDLKEAGVEMVPFGPVKLPFLSNKFNFRNHRKIIVIDGKIGFIGGLNIGDEYLGRVEQFGFWRDTHMIVKGEAVKTLQLIFVQDWYYMTNDSFFTPGYIHNEHLVAKEDGAVQIIAGGPDNEWSVIKNLFFSMITSAKKSVWIASPYFIPDEDIFSALKIASLSGIDVRIMIPKKPDKQIVWHASRSYFPELLEAGAKIYQYNKGFMHSKVLIVDEELASIGTSNMDMRSFHLNFEVNAFLYQTESTKALMNDFIEDLQNSEQLSYEEFSKRSIWIRIIESTSRLMSPLL
ncbi:cardiolipin synthetase [Bacillus coahuilensis p1.1.43]|uniref:Cardiolipin synthase n=1 Tax=Bacillus coahuilensis p1.1.43 TaxID=1150625 RepID=A0A147KA74_9BACI|nr:cardiolipin synthase [Bacillus coahuilensis]KUP07528.1 cardiolipin synthetase [Bacillus coahuilensis p1.1.43]